MPKNAPRRLVEFSRSALDSNLSTLASVSRDAVIDLRCDAYGHGADWVGQAARDHGFTSFLSAENPTAPIPESASHVYGTSGGDRVAVVSSELITIKEIPAGDSVSYGYTWTAPTDSRLGLVSLGFADGLPRAGSNIGTVTLREHAVPVVGRIAMDQFVIDISAVTAEVGDVISVWDTADSVLIWANAAGRHPLSLVPGLSWRVERSWVA